MESKVLSSMIITDSKVPMVSFVCHRMGIAGVANVTITRSAIIIKGTVNTPSATTGRPRRIHRMMTSHSTSDSTRATLVGKATTAVSVNVSDQSSHYKKTDSSNNNNSFAPDTNQGYSYIGKNSRVPQRLHGSNQPQPFSGFLQPSRFCGLNYNYKITKKALEL